MRFFYVFLFMVNTSCAYQLGYLNKSLPQDFQSVQIPTFINDTKYVGIETYFTNELKSLFYRTQTAKIDDAAPVYIEGQILRVFVDQTRARADFEDFEGLLPDNTVITTRFDMTVDVYIKLIRKSDKKVIWQSEFTDLLPFSGAQLKLEGLNSSNTMYNQSAIRQNVKRMASVLMSQVHTRMTENF